VSPSLEIQSLPPIADPVKASRIIVNDFHTGIAERWDEFVLRQQSGTLFHLMAWKRVIERNFGFRSHYCYVERNGVITAVVPLFFVTNWVVGDCLHSVPFGVYGGICAADQDSSNALVSHLKQLALSMRVKHLDLHQQHGEVFPDFHPNSLYSTFTTTLSADHEINLKKLPRDTRYMIRRAEKAGLRVQFGLDQLSVFYPLFCESMRRLGTPVFPRTHFANLIQEFGSQVDLMMVYSGSQAVTGVLSFFFRDTIMPYYAGAGSAAGSLAANNFMYWQLMKYAAEKGFRTFDFGRSKKNTGAYGFKSQWGMDIEQLNYQTFLVRRATVPNFSPANPKFAMATRVWRRLPLELTNRLGPHIVRWFP
jgi:FemAB-related protein (PEP-CTERM system-associated)